MIATRFNYVGGNRTGRAMAPADKNPNGHRGRAAGDYPAVTGGSGALMCFAKNSSATSGCWAAQL